MVAREWRLIDRWDRWLTQVWIAPNSTPNSHSINPDYWKVQNIANKRLRYTTRYGQTRAQCGGGICDP